MAKQRELSADEKINVQKMIELLREKEKQNLLILNNGREKSADMRAIDKEIKYKLGIADSTYSNILRGKRTLGTEYCLRIVNLYHLDVSSLAPDLADYVKCKQYYLKNKSKDYIDFT